jgi:hypothetical protein
LTKSDHVVLSVLQPVAPHSHGRSAMSNVHASHAESAAHYLPDTNLLFLFRCVRAAHCASQLFVQVTRICCTLSVMPTCCFACVCVRAAYCASQMIVQLKRICCILSLIPTCCSACVLCACSPSRLTTVAALPLVTSKRRSSWPTSSASSATGGGVTLTGQSSRTQVRLAQC